MRQNGAARPLRHHELRSANRATLNITAPRLAARETVMRTAGMNEAVLDIAPARTAGRDRINQWSRRSP
jgi:hypothetical protein